MMKYVRNLLYGLVVTLPWTIPSLAQQEGSQPDPGAGVYTIPYVLPTPESIKNVLNRVYAYFDKAPLVRVIDKKTGKEITTMKQVIATADFERSGNDVISLWGYTSGVTYAAMLRAAETTNDITYRNYPQKSINFILTWLPYFKKIDSLFGEQKNAYEPILHTRSLDDCGAMGAALIKLYKVTNDERLLPLINHIADYISNKQFRLSDGTLARQRPQAQSVWADDAYMCIPFLAQMGHLTGNKKYYDDAVHQVRQMKKYLWRPEKKLFDHGFNVHCENDPNFYWARANGWVMMAIVELLDVLPEHYEGRMDILRLLREHVQGVAEVQGKNGLWHNLLDKNDSFEETSSTAMFVYSIAHAINKGWVDYTYGPVAQAGWNALATKVKENGEVEGTCWGTTFANDIVYYYHRPTSVAASHGYGPVIFAAAEMLALVQNEKLSIRLSNRAYHYRLRSDVK
ncbi:MAG: glycoside hydrolase family 88 protein [Bacteroidetes bacterium]|nr:glycoside hydrolase family 88 protein [Bacteroidota bacterium]